MKAWERRILQHFNCFQKQRVGYRVGQGFVSRNPSRNKRGRVQGEVLLVPMISCSNEATWNKPTRSHLFATGSWGGVISRLLGRSDVLFTSSGSLLPPKCLPWFLPFGSGSRRGVTKPVDIPGVTVQSPIISVTKCVSKYQFIVKSLLHMNNQQKM